MQVATVQELKQILETNPSTHLLDVRELNERNEFNIGGHFIPLGKIANFETDEIADLQNEALYVYCRSGMRSMQACMLLEQAGFTNVINVNGGMLAWRDAFGQ